MDLENKLAVVTGGARRVGRAIVRGLAEDGAKVIVHCHRSLEKATALADEVGGHVVQADLSRSDGGATLAAQVESLAHAGELAVWVNAAASFERQPFLSSDDDLWRQTLQLVLLSPVAAVRRLAPTMVDGGVVVNVLDVAAHQPWKGYAHHCVAKAALLMLTRTLAVELAPRLRSCGVSPGVVMLPEGATESTAERARKRVPLGRLGAPEDVAQAVRFLVRADYVTGSVLAVDGGLMARLPD